MNEKTFENFNLYNELKNSLEEAIAYKNGDKSKARSVVRELPTPEYTGNDVRKIREKYNLSQKSLSVVLGVSKRTVEAWEAGKNTPSHPSNKLLYLIDKDSKIIEELVTV